MENSYNTSELVRMDRQHIWHPFTHMKQWMAEAPLVITQANGMELIDSDGNRYLDGVSSLWCNVHGHQVPEIDEAIKAQLKKVSHSTMLGLASEPAIVLADRLMKQVPPGLTKIFYSDAGATATEIAFKLAAQYWFNIGHPEKCEFVGFIEAYHGDTVGAMSIGRTEAFHRPYFPMLFKAHFAPTPFPYRFNPTCDCNNAVCDRTGCTPDSDVKTQCLACLEHLLENNHQTIAAVCIEPLVQGAAGMIVHPEGFLRGVRELCTRYNVLLIADEVAVGFGRTGTMFACEQEGVSPDLMCVAKGITGGYMPLAATFATQAIFDAFLGDPWEGKTFFHGHTYTGNPLACAAACASLDLFEKNDLLTKVRSKATWLADALARQIAPIKHVGDIRQKGLMVGIELVEDRDTKKPFDARRRVGAAVCQAIRKRGVIIRPLGDVLILMPPLAMETDDLARLVAAVEAEVLKL
jgi:adenosylmethionine-8-amino-7-oxononanoate aminotransferase